MLIRTSESQETFLPPETRVIKLKVLVLAYFTLILGYTKLLPLINLQKNLIFAF